MLAATTSARIRSASIAEPDVSINPNRFMAHAPFSWFVFTDHGSRFTKHDS
jgi:hypothetical protein